MQNTKKHMQCQETYRVSLMKVKVFIHLPTGTHTEWEAQLFIWLGCNFPVPTNPYWEVKIEIVSLQAGIMVGSSKIFPCHSQRYVYLPDSFEMFRKLWPRACPLSWLHAVITQDMYSETCWADGQFPRNNIPLTDSCFSLFWVLLLKYLPAWLTKIYCLTYVIYWICLFIYFSLLLNVHSPKDKIFFFVTPVSIKVIST